MVQKMLDSVQLTNPELRCNGEDSLTCGGCGGKIHDRYLMRVADINWHEGCLQCSVCGLGLSHSCYFRNNKLYCKSDYDRLYGVKCARCGDRLLPHEMVMRAQHHVYHLPCFVCVICCQPLQKGEQYILRSGQLFCRQDFEKEMYLMQQASPSDELLLDETCRRDGRRGPKRPRTILTSSQRRQFKASFEVSPKPCRKVSMKRAKNILTPSQRRQFKASFETSAMPCRKVREALAKDTGLSVRVVQVWFQNQRAKMKKIQRKAKQQDADKTSHHDKDDSQPHIKQEPHSEGHYLSLGMSLQDSSDSIFASSTKPLNPNHPYSPEDSYAMHSADSFCSSDLSLDESTNLDEGEGGSDSLSLDLGPPHHDPMLTSLGQINPIDKLYLMQNSYFSNAEQ